MSSEAAQKAYPKDERIRDVLTQWHIARQREAFDRGAVEALRQAAAIAEQYAAEALEQRNNSDYPESWIGMQYHGLYHGANDVLIRINRAVDEWVVGQ